MEHAARNSNSEGNVFKKMQIILYADPLLFMCDLNDTPLWDSICTQANITNTDMDTVKITGN